MSSDTTVKRESKSRLQFTRLLSVGIIVALYYVSQWLTNIVSLSELLPLPPEQVSVHWVAAIDHHLVQLLFALVCIWYLSRGEWRSWGLNANNLAESKRLLTRGFLPVLVGFLFLGELLVPVLLGVPPTFEYELTAVNVSGMLLFMGIVSGFSEEILFRGLIQTYLSRVFDSVYPFFGHELPLAGVIAAVIFTIAHVGFTFSPLGVFHFQPPQLLLAFVLGLYYAVAYHETESLVAPIVAHNAVNGTIIIATFLAAWILGA